MTAHMAKPVVLTVTALLLLVPLMASTTAFAACSCPGCTSQRIAHQKKVTVKSFTSAETQSMKSIKWDLSITDGWMKMWLTSNGQTVEVGNSLTSTLCRHEEVDIHSGTAYSVELECYMGQTYTQEVCLLDGCFPMSVVSPCTGYSGASLSASASSSASSKTTIIIAVCCSVGGALLIALVVVLCCCCRRSPAGPANGPKPNPSDPHAHGGDTKNEGATVIEMHPQPAAELSSEDPSKECSKTAV